MIMDLLRVSDDVIRENVAANYGNLRGGHTTLNSRAIFRLHYGALLE